MMEGDPCECLRCGTPLHVFPPEVAAVIRDDNPVAVSDELATFADREGTRYVLADVHQQCAAVRPPRASGQAPRD